MTRLEMTRALPVALLLTLAGCSPAPGAATAAQESDESTANASEALRGPDYTDAPASARAIVSLLSARHATDLPDAAALEAHETPAEALRWIATHHPRMLVRGRALASLRFFDDRATRGLLLETLRDVDSHATLRAQAASGSAALPMDDALTDALGAARASGDPRVVRAVDRRLAAQLVVDDAPGALRD